MSNDKPVVRSGSEAAPHPPGRTPAPRGTAVDQVNDQRTEQANTNANDQQNVCQPEQRTRVGVDQAATVHHNAPVQQTDWQQVHITVQNVWPGAGGGPVGTDLAGSLAGQVCRSGDGRPVAGAPVEIFFGPPFGAPVHTCHTDGAGSFYVGDLPMGFYAICVRSPGLTASAEQVNLRVRPGQTTWHRLSLGGAPDTPVTATHRTRLDGCRRVPRRP